MIIISSSHRLWKCYQFCSMKENFFRNWAQNGFQILSVFLRSHFQVINTLGLFNILYPNWLSLKWCWYTTKIYYEHLYIIFRNWDIPHERYQKWKNDKNAPSSEAKLTMLTNEINLLHNLNGKNTLWNTTGWIFWVVSGFIPCVMSTSKERGS